MAKSLKYKIMKLKNKKTLKKYGGSAEISDQPTENITEPGQTIEPAVELAESTNPNPILPEPIPEPVPVAEPIAEPIMEESIPAQVEEPVAEEIAPVVEEPATMLEEPVQEVVEEETPQFPFADTDLPSENLETSEKADIEIPENVEEIVNEQQPEVITEEPVIESLPELDSTPVVEEPVSVEEPVVEPPPVTTEEGNKGLTIELLPKELEKLTLNLNKNILMNLNAIMSVLTKLKAVDINEDSKKRMDSNMDILKNVISETSYVFKDLQEAFGVPVENPEDISRDENAFLENVLSAQSAAVMAAAGYTLTALLTLGGGGKSKKNKSKKGKKKTKSAPIKI